MKKLILLLFIVSNCANASMLWKIDNGIKLFDTGNYKNAVKYFESYINSNPNDENGYFWLAKSYKQLNDKKANYYFQKAYLIASNSKNLEKITFKNENSENLEDYFDMASSYYSDANFKEALNYAQMMLKIDPDSASAYFIKAKIASIEEDKISATNYLRNAIILNNSLINTKLAKELGFNKIPELTKRENILFAQKAYFKGDINQCIHYLQKYIELDKTNTDAYALLIDCYLKNKNLENAKNTIEEAQKFNENNITLLLSNAEIEQNNNEKYESILLKAYSINPNNKTVLLKLGNFYLDKKNYPHAKKYFETLINIDDKFYEAYFGYIYSLIQMQEFDIAQTKIANMSLLNENNSESLYLTSLLCFSKNEYQEALNYIQQAIQKEVHSQYYLEAGKLNYILGNLENAKKYLTPLNNIEAKEYLALAYLKLNDGQSAKKLIEELYTIDKNRILYKYYLYKICQSDSKEELKALLKQKPMSYQEYVDFITIYILENKKDSLNKTISSANKKFGNDTKFQNKLKELIAQSGNIQN